MLKRAIGFFIIFSPFTSYFAVSPWLRFPVLIIIFVYLLFLIKIVLARKIPTQLLSKIAVDEAVLLLVLICVAFSFIFNGTGLNHLLAYGFAFTICYIYLKKIIEYEKIAFLFVLRMFACSSFICGLIIILDWILINLFSVGFRKFFVSVDYKTANMLYYQKEYFTTVGGVAEEPGSMALLMNIIFPLGLLYLKLRGKHWRFMLLLGVYVLSSFFVFSAAGIIAVSIAFGSVLVLNLLRRTRGSKIRQKPLIVFCFISAFVVGFGLIGISRNIEVIRSQGVELKDKITFSEQNVSADIRIETWRSAIERWGTSPIWGNGPGDGVKRSGSGYHNVYLTLLADAGLFSVLLFLFFLMLQFFKLRAVPSGYRVYIFVALFSTVIHFSIVGDFYHAPFWILLILINLMLGVNYSKKIA